MSTWFRASEQTETPIWSPQPGPQHALVLCPVFEIFYGGARGGGKTDGMLGKFALKADRFGRGAKGVFFRRELPQLESAMARSHEIYAPLGAVWREQAKMWIFPGGATLRFRPLERDQDAEKYQGHDYTDLFFEELTNWPDPSPVMKLKATLRSARGVPVQWHGTGNPGGPGHQWVKKRYIDPAPQGWHILNETYTNPWTGDQLSRNRIFIPARLSDNKKLLKADPAYVANLYQSGSAALVRAWLEGDWSVIDGAFFDCWDMGKHVLQPFEVPKHWLRFRSMDWGSARPFSVGWWAVASDGLHKGAQHIPAGAMVRYREWYGMVPNKPNVGLKLTAEQVADGIHAREKDDSIVYGVADPAMFSSDGGPSIAERMAGRGVHFRAADNARLARNGAMGGWDAMRSRLVGEDGRPMLFCFATCVDSIRTIPALMHDPIRAEDLDTQGEDHAADEWRYAVMSRPWVAPRPTPPKPKDRWSAFDEMEQTWKTL